MIIKAIIANTKFGLLILDSDNENFEETFVDNPDIDNIVNINRELENLQKESYGLYECELSWIEEDVYLESYKNKHLTWEI